MNPPMVSAVGLWYGYFPAQVHPGDDADHQLAIENAGTQGNETLFSSIENGVSLTHRAMVTVDLHASCMHDVAIERDLAVQLDKGASGGLMPRGRSKFVAGMGNSAYQGILETGHCVRAIVAAPGDEVDIIDGYVSVLAQPV